VYIIGSPAFQFEIGNWLETSIQSPSQCQVTIQNPDLTMTSPTGTASSMNTDFIPATLTVWL
jgi:hypothetical protein